ncbi:hypothetical protein KBI33_00240 [Candidatus Shapirobacteria bacterium]|nr:hypothetical protein [Candidatus Shapirobacteria bacterium]
MFHSLIITGASKKRRVGEAEKIRSQYNSCPADADPDCLLLEEGTIEAVRQAKIWLARKPFSGNKKIVIIVEAQNLTLPAQNALLKTLEEPPANSRLILTIPNPALLLPTVVSRCQIIHLQPKQNISLKETSPQQEIYQKSAAEKIILAQEKGINLESAKSWLRGQRKFWQEKFPENLPEASFWLEKTLLCEQMLKQNVSPRLVLTYFLLK